MFAVVFEVLPAPGRREEYLGLAGRLKPILESIDGFLDNQRFESRTRPGWMLSLSLWRDEKSVVRWRAQGEHHVTQGRGRGGVFAEYHLRVCEITADTDPPSGMTLAAQRLDETETGVAKSLAITEVPPLAGSPPRTDPALFTRALGLAASMDGLAGHDVFESIHNPGKMLLLSAWKTAAAAAAWRPAASGGMGTPRHRSMRVIRDYGLFDRREAPQYHPPARKPDARPDGADVA